MFKYQNMYNMKCQSVIVMLCVLVLVAVVAGPMVCRDPGSGRWYGVLVALRLLFPVSALVPRRSRCHTRKGCFVLTGSTFGVLDAHYGVGFGMKPLHRSRGQQ
jgi:hypothetical protein